LEDINNLLSQVETFKDKAERLASNNKLVELLLLKQNYDEIREKYELL